jgi:hypothetical protein
MKSEAGNVEELIRHDQHTMLLIGGVMHLLSDGASTGEVMQALSHINQHLQLHVVTLKAGNTSLNQNEIPANSNCEGKKVDEDHPNGEKNDEFDPGSGEVAQGEFELPNLEEATDFPEIQKQQTFDNSFLHICVFEEKKENSNVDLVSKRQNQTEEDFTTILQDDPESKLNVSHTDHDEDLRIDVSNVVAIPVNQVKSVIVLDLDIIEGLTSEEWDVRLSTVEKLREMLKIAVMQEVQLTDSRTCQVSKILDTLVGMLEKEHHPSGLSIGFSCLMYLGQCIRVNMGQALRNRILDLLWKYLGSKLHNVVFDAASQWVVFEVEFAGGIIHRFNKNKFPTKRFIIAVFNLLKRIYVFFSVQDLPVELKLFRLMKVILKFGSGDTQLFYPSVNSILKLLQVDRERYNGVVAEFKQREHQIFLEKAGEKIFNGFR